MGAFSNNVQPKGAHASSDGDSDRGFTPQSNASEKLSSSALPTVTLPKGGGAIRGIGEKFTANMVTGTGSLSVPIATSPGRSGFDPQLTLSYDSGAGNGPFGLGWNLSLPSITRKTDKGLPKYYDAEEPDEFILSGAEDLVPVLKQRDNDWIPEDVSDRTIGNNTYCIKRYRPRIEGLFARIERWTNKGKPEDTYWRSISKDNITTWYGKTENSRIFDPADKTHIFSWLIYQSYDDKGNAIIYDYVPENSEGIDKSQANECNRTLDTRKVNRYLKRIKYGNLKPNRDVDWNAIDPIQLTDWMFEVVFDYDEGHYTEEKAQDSTQHDYASAQIDPPANSTWPVRQDPFSSYKAGFEVRTYRLCHRILMFHHFPDELGVSDYLVHSTEFQYNESQVASFLTSVTQSGYKHQDDGKYLKKSLPALQFKYSEVPDENELTKQPVLEVDPESLENLPIGLDGTAYQWADLHGEGIPGILTEQAGAWFYKRNLSPIPVRDNGTEHLEALFAPVELVNIKPAVSLAGGQAQFMDLAGDGQPDLVVLDGPMPGLYEHDDAEGWQSFRPFTSRLSRDMRDPNVKLVDLDGDGHADVLITEDDALIWHPSLAEEGFGPAIRVAQALDEEKGPRLVFADGTQSIYLADLSGDGLTDLIRIRNGEVCYWPNLGYGRFGAKVTMDDAPCFDNPDQFDQRRVRLADIDGFGTTDIIYLARDGVHLYFNQSGNRWSDPVVLPQLPPINNIASLQALDLLGNGMACLVWSSALPENARKPMRYIRLMGEQKPHLLTKVVNNLGAETDVEYASSTEFYLRDKYNGKTWITKLPFPVHVVERVVTYDRISRNRFTTRYAYHHGCFDGTEREFRGFGMVEQWDTEEYATLEADGLLDDAENLDKASHIPPVLTRTWFHTGAYLERNRISTHFAGEYYGAPDPTDANYENKFAKFIEMELLPDTVPPETILKADGKHSPHQLTMAELREACRALKGSILRQEVYAEDKSLKAPYPYTVSERNYTIELLQPYESGVRHAVFFVHPREAIDYHYERNSADPRVSHSITLAVDAFGNVLESLSIGYGRYKTDQTLAQLDQSTQSATLVTYTRNRYTNAIPKPSNHEPPELDAYRVPLPCETRTYELVKPPEPPVIDGVPGLFRFETINILMEGLFPSDQVEPSDAKLWPYEKWDWRTNLSNMPAETRLRLLEHERTLYRADDLSMLLSLSELKSMALRGESYKLAFTPDLVAEAFGIRVTNTMLQAEGGYVQFDDDINWWIPSGRVYYHPDPNTSSQQEEDEAKKHFYLPRRFTDPFRTHTKIQYDDCDLLVLETEDALSNKVTACNDYRVLQSALVTDPNGNRSAVAFDALGMVVGTAVMGKSPPAPREGDSLDGFEANLTETVLLEHVANPLADPHSILQKATTRLVYDLFAYHRTKDEPQPQPNVVYTLARETHDSDLDHDNDKKTKVQYSFSYSDGFGREIQKKIQAEPGPVPKRDGAGKIIIGLEGQPELTDHDVTPRWVGSGWTIFNNKGKPVSQYEPFFSDTHKFDDDTQIGVSPVLFYDPAERVVATLHPNDTYEKVVFDAWQQATWDVNDTVKLDPRNDEDIQGYVERFFEKQQDWETWLQQRIPDPQNPLPDSHGQNPEHDAAVRALDHADTPAKAYLDSLGRTFLTVADNGLAEDGTERKYRTRMVLDIEGNSREVIDARNRAVMLYDYDMLGNRIHQASTDAGERWMLNDVMGKPICAWDSRKHALTTKYDVLRRPNDIFMSYDDGAELLVQRTIYGESQSKPETTNLRGQVYQIYDGAVVVTNVAYDFKGNLLRSKRQLAEKYKETLDWSQNPALEAETFTSGTRYDALNRPIQLVAPHSDKAETKINITQPVYNEANLLERINVWLGRVAEPVDLLDPDDVGTKPDLRAVTDIDYNAKGQRTLIEYGMKDADGADKVVRTEYTYDSDTFRLIRLKTTRPHFPQTQQLLQDLSYTYDPVGNITHTCDDAQQVVFFNNQVVEPHADYIYDAIYRLIEATGREHLGQTADGSAKPPTLAGPMDGPCVGQPHPSDGKVMGRYLQRYLYDEVGNILSMRHLGTDPKHPGWKRCYQYAIDSNRLLSTGPPIDPEDPDSICPSHYGPIPTHEEHYEYDEHGNIIQMPHLPLMKWDYRDQLQATSQQEVNNSGTPETTYYVYDSNGQRVRKVTELQASAGQIPVKMKERIYLGGFEIYREHSGANAGLVRETLHIMDEKQRIALVETRNDIDDGTPKQLIRYQFGNHLGSVSLELDDKGEIISYEEYTPYGSTSYQAVRKDIEVPLKRYRYTGKEQDEETGLYYHGARYYAPWLARWVSCDPIMLLSTGKDDQSTLRTNSYQYARQNPERNFDPDGRTEKSFIITLSEQSGIEKKLAKGSDVYAKGFEKHGFVHIRVRSVDEMVSMIANNLTEKDEIKRIILLTHGQQVTTTVQYPGGRQETSIDMKVFLPSREAEKNKRGMPVWQSEETLKRAAERAGEPFSDMENLRKVQGATSKDTIVEIRGCNVGKDPGLMRVIGRFFGGSGVTVIAPRKGARLNFNDDKANLVLKVGKERIPYESPKAEKYKERIKVDEPPLSTRFVPPDIKLPDKREVLIP